MECLCFNNTCLCGGAGRRSGGAIPSELLMSPQFLVAFGPATLCMLSCMLVWRKLQARRHLLFRVLGALVAVAVAVHDIPSLLPSHACLALPLSPATPAGLQRACRFITHHLWRYHALYFHPAGFPPHVNFHPDCTAATNKLLD